MTRFDDKVAVITGASRGLGLHVAMKLASLGARVVLLARTAAELDAAAERIRGEGGHCHRVCGDVADPQVRARLIEQTVETFGRLDLLINNAAMWVAGDLHDTDLHAYRNAHRVNVFAVAHLCQLAIPIMNSGEYGRIVNLSSGFGWNTLPGLGVYAATKAGLNMVTKQLAAEVSPQGVITVNGVAPGLVETPGFEALLDEVEGGGPQPAFAGPRGPLHNAAARYHFSYLGRPVHMDEVTEVVCFLCSPAASGVTGETLNLGGGSFPR